MQKALLLQAEMGPVFDITLDLDTGAASNGAATGSPSIKPSPSAEIEQAQLVREWLDSDDNRYGRVGVRLLPVSHCHFADTAGIVLRARKRPAYLMCPQANGLADVQRAASLLEGLGAAAVPLHVTIETHGALRDVAAIAQHPRVQCLGFDLMNFVAACRGAIPASVASGAGQFDHPLVVRAKLEIAAACHAAGKTPAHSAFGSIADAQAVHAAADMASSLLGYTRMCSIHPAQIRPILTAFAPSQAEVDTAIGLLRHGQQADWHPTQFEGQAQDLASYRAWWHVLERADRVQRGWPAGADSPAAPATLPADIRAAWFAAN